MKHLNSEVHLSISVIVNVKSILIPAWLSPCYHA